MARTGTFAQALRQALAPLPIEVTALPESRYSAVPQNPMVDAWIGNDSLHNDAFPSASGVLPRLP
jgi:hypothetical protein